MIPVNQSISQFFNRPAVTVPAETLVTVAVDEMWQRDISSLVITDVEGYPVGIFTERDLVRSLSCDGPLDGVQIAELMTAEPVTATADISYLDAYQLLAEHAIRHLVIVEAGKCIGMLTDSDILHNLESANFIEQGHVSDVMNRHIVSVDGSEPLGQVAQLMHRQRISCVLVRIGTELSGIITERDMVKLARNGTGARQISCAEVMSSPLNKIPVDASLLEAITRMQQSQIRHLVVTDFDGGIVGKITRQFVVRILRGRYTAYLRNVIESQVRQLDYMGEQLSEKLVLNNVLNSTDQAIVAVDLDLRIVYYNPLARSLIAPGCSKDLKGCLLSGIDEIRPVFDEFFSLAPEQIARGQTLTHQFSMAVQDDEIRYLDAKATGVRDQRGQLVGYMLLVRDVTENHLAQAYLESEKKRYARLFEAVRDAILIVDPVTAMIQDVNPAACLMYGYSRDEFLQLSILDISAEKEKTVITLSDCRAAPAHGIRIPHRRHRSKSGKEFPVEVTVSPYRLNGAQLMMCNLRDISERQASEQILLEIASYFSNLDRVNSILANARHDEIDSSLQLVARALLDMLEADRVWITYPCDPQADFWKVPIEAAQPAFASTTARREKVEVNAVSCEVLKTPISVIHGFQEADVPQSLAENFSVKSMLIQAVYPDKQSPWMLELHQCRYNREWTDAEIRMFSAVGERLSMVMTNLLLLQQLECEIRQQKAAQEKIRQSDLRFSTVASQAPVGIFSANATGDCTYVNERWCKLAGFSYEQAMQQGWINAIHPDDRERFLHGWGQVTAAEKQEFSSELRFITPQGSVSHLQVRVVALHDINGKVDSYIGILSDVTELKRLQRELSQVHKMEAMGQLTGGIAHDFNNILASILGFSNLSLSRFAEVMPEKMVSYLGEIKKAGERGRDLVRQMLTFARSGNVEPRELDLGQLVTETSKMLISTFPSSIQIEVKVEDNLPRVFMDPVQFNQLVMNLCINARDAMDGSGELRLQLSMAHESGEECALNHTWVTGDWVELSVIDTGSGIEDAVLKRMFDPFYTTKQVGHGTGMGLAVASSILQYHQGHMIVETKVGFGSCFRLLFPPVGESKAAAEVPAEGKSWPLMPVVGRGQRILVLDDEPALVAFISDLLQGHGFNVTGMVDSQAALALLQERPGEFDLLISDQTMPNLTGAELVLATRVSNPLLPVIICTGFSEHMNQDKATELGVEYCFSKPVDPEELLAAVQQLLTE